MRGAFSENFVRIDTEIVALKRRDEDLIDVTSQENVLSVTTKEEAKEIIRLLQEGLKYLP